jgi:hypothetical protein
MKTYIFCLFLIISLISKATDFYPARVILIDGSSISGFSSIPSNGAFSKKIKFKTKKNTNIANYKAGDVHQLIINLDEENTYIFESGTRAFVGKKYLKKSKDRCTDKKKSWFLVTSYSDKITTYKYGDSYKIKKTNTMVVKSKNSGGWASIYLLVKRSDESCMAMMGEISYGAKVIGQEKTFRKSTRRYFADQPVLVDRIQKKEFKIEDLQILVNEYRKLI